MDAETIEKKSPSFKNGRFATFFLKTGFAYDSKIVEFEEKEHVYKVDGRSADLSASSVINTIFASCFNANEEATRIVESRLRKLASGNTKLSPSESKIPGNLSRQKQIQFLLKDWEYARDNGTMFHSIVEDRINEELGKTEPSWQTMTFPRLPLKMQPSFTSLFQDLYLEGWVPVETEKRVFIEFEDNVRLAGSMDCVLKRLGSKNEMMIIDWKFCNQVSSFSFRGKCGDPEFDCGNLPASNYHKYSVQLVIYREFLSCTEQVSVDEVKLAIFWVSPKSGKGKLMDPLDVDGPAQRGTFRLIDKLQRQKRNSLATQDK